MFGEAGVGDIKGGTKDWVSRFRGGEPGVS